MTRIHSEELLLEIRSQFPNLMAIRYTHAYDIGVDQPGWARMRKVGMKQPIGQFEASNIGAPKTVSEKAYRILRSDIVWGKLKPGAPLRSDELRRKYDVGISPLREALSRLTTERLVTSAGQRGFSVAPIDESTVIDISETRLVIECAALKRSIERGDVDWETRIVAAHHALSRASIPISQGPEAEIWAARHREFHMSLLSASDSEWMMYLAGLFFDQAERFRIVRALTAESTDTERDPLREHQAIVDAVLERDAARAEETLRRHYQTTTDFVLASLKANED